MLSLACKPWSGEMTFMAPWHPALGAAGPGRCGGAAPPVLSCRFLVCDFSMWWCLCCYSLKYVCFSNGPG